MFAQKYFIRGIASLIYTIKRRELRNPQLKLLVFTGTSGKTTTRDAVVFGLRALGERVESNHVGYSNELGILLTAFGIPEASLKNFSTWKKILQHRLTQDTYVCVESGADFADDLPWLLRRFIPHAVFVSGVTHEAWAGDLERTARQRRRLLRTVPKNGLIVYHADDEALAEDIRAARPKAATKSVTLNPMNPADVALTNWSYKMYSLPAEDLYEAKDNIVIQDDQSHTRLPIQLNRALFEPQILALLMTYAFLITRFPDAPERLAGVFDQYTFSHNRLQLSQARSGALIIEDSYKATPFCTTWLLERAQLIHAKRKILVLSELRPLETNIDTIYQRIGELTRSFDEVYFVGPVRFFEELKKSNPAARHIEDAADEHFVSQLAHDTRRGDAIFLKGSFRYHLDELRAKLV